MGDNRDPVNPSPGPCTETRYSVRGEAHGLHVADAERGYQLVDAYNRRIAPDLFEAAYVLLAEAGKLRELLRGQAFLLPDRLDVPPDQLAHVHAPEVSG